MRRWKDCELVSAQTIASALLSEREGRLDAIIHLPAFKSAF